MPADRMSAIPFSGIRKIFEECDRLEAAGEDVVHLEIGRPDFDTPEPIKDAGKDALDRGEVHYTSNYGIEPLRRGIAEKLATDNGLQYDPDGGIIVTSGATEAVFCTVVALVGPGDEVLVPDPSWTYRPSIETAGATRVPYPVSPEEGFQPDVEALAERASDDTELLIVNTPHNPTGGMLDADHAAAIRDVAVEHDLTVLSDEIYEKIRYDRDHVSLGALDGMYDRTVTVNGFSKAYSMTGWRLGYLAAPESLVDPIIRLRQYTTTCAPSIAQHAGVRALEGTLEAPMVEAFERRRDLVADRIADVPGMTCPTPSGAFYAFPTVPEGVDDETEFVYSLLREAGVALVPGTVFGETGAGRVRIAYSNSADRIDEAFDRIEAWLAAR
ncbi:pyridoxal phosphate-dependent aminotransferase [Halopenitus persicus]|uniref:pyridoxal phosphate-dependent aminotransferase n=1 Tax=Halopenitus persicus TaxID=1048396 RepID=UPI0018EEBD2C|nr:pyridoxal phosphate-dependent aminotransferase [Halopenitus persicus]